ncbi:cytochrome P450, putative [Talaromyces stipitatus ATCC 10500]|uniref:Cytochrome P450, putative n=1 Tax=Talaromyces stipitatus (strain ATCC 10500 / CBS 375.48 / QM 6759 / NRRL 1006) TaxID=441959 RepID=B8MBB8_TALSN|nr:cytochrome P450, putative [Talaromyces stipitatus ATCC 10500]EED18907.1 cytochrome P450, putative [Talaromyces stipitatus ATCC 10500]
METVTNLTSSTLVARMDFNAQNFQSPVTISLAGLLATLISLLAYMSYSPPIDKRSPAFTSDTVPFIGSWRFFTQKLPFWRNSMALSKTGNFSFWLGKNHVVGVSGEASRKMYLESRSLHLIKGITLIGHGPDFIDGRSTVIHNIWKSAYTNDRTYATRRLLDLQKSEHLVKRLPRVTRDARLAFEEMPNNATGVMNPTKVCYRLVVMQGSRLICSNEIADDPQQLNRLVRYVSTLQSTSSLHLLAFPWLSYFSVSYWKRRWGRNGITQIVKPIVNRRMRKGAPRFDDSLQFLIESGDSKDYITNFLISMLFIVAANAGVLSGAMLNIVAHHPKWQEKIYDEIKAAAAIHSKNSNAPLVDQLDSIPLGAWETSFPSIDLCYKEAIRMWVAFPMGRFNDTHSPIPIPGTNEVIPPGSFACYNTLDVHYNEKLYPDPMKWDPERFLERREEYKKEAYGYMGWGAGRHPCTGMRWAKLQQNIILAYALALYKWSGCDEHGDPNPHFAQPTTALNELAPRLPQGLWCKYVPRENV